MTRPNDLSIAGWHRLYVACAGRADEVEKGLSAEIGEELTALETAWPRDLPSGVIHARQLHQNLILPESVFLDDRFAHT